MCGFCDGFARLYKGQEVGVRGMATEVSCSLKSSKTQVGCERQTCRKRTAARALATWGERVRESALKVYI